MIGCGLWKANDHMKQSIGGLQFLTLNIELLHSNDEM